MLPGGRIVAPTGEQFPTGAGPFGLAVSPSGKMLVTANLGPGLPSLTELERTTHWEVRQLPTAPTRPGDAADDNLWRGVSLGITFTAERTLYVSEGNSGRVASIDLATGERRRAIDLNIGGYHDSFTGDLAWDPQRNILYVADQANFRIACIDMRSRQVVASVRVGRSPFAVVLSPDRRRLYVTHPGMFQYQSLSAPVPFPPLGFPGGDLPPPAVAAPPLGDPNAPESNSVGVVDISDPAAPKLETYIPTGEPFGGDQQSGSSPFGIVAAAGRLFVANSAQDSITVIDPETNRREREIAIRIPGLEDLRGVIPMGLAYDAGTGWLLVAEAGINAIGVIDPRTAQVLGHIPAGWFPARIVTDRGSVFVTNLRGGGSFPSAAVISGIPRVASSPVVDGSLSIYPLPRSDALPELTRFVMESCGFVAHPVRPPAISPGIHHVVLIAKGNRSFDEVLGDLTAVSNGRVMAAPQFARFGSEGYVNGRREQLSLHNINLTPNQHAVARRWSFSDNFYTDADSGVLGYHWLAGLYPPAWSAFSAAAALGGGREFRSGSAPGRLAFGAASAVLPEDLVANGTLWAYLENHGVSALNFGGGLDFPGFLPDDRSPAGGLFPTNVPLLEPPYRTTSRAYPAASTAVSDTERALRFIAAIQRDFVGTGAALPQFLYLSLPNDQPREPRKPGYPYAESFVVDNDDAVGRVFQFLSGTPWWKDMVVFLTEAAGPDGGDHIDAHRTLLLCAGPWAKSGYVSHTNASSPGLRKTILEIFGLPPLNLFDASAADLSDCLRSEPDPAPYQAISVDPRVYDPSPVLSTQRP